MEGALPLPLTMPNAEPNGAFDPSLAYDPETGRLWMSYSGVALPTGTGLVSTHLVYSEDNGTTWCHKGIVNQGEEIPPDERPAAYIGMSSHWNHETSSIVHDPGAPTSARWKLLWHRYLMADGQGRWEHGWIGLREAATPEELLDAPERRLFSHLSSYVIAGAEDYNISVLGPPEVRLDQIHSDLNGCLMFAEAGMVSWNNVLYVALMCVEFNDPEFVDRMFLLTLDHSSESWAYAGTLLTTADARAIHPDLQSITAPELFIADGKHYMLATPAHNTGPYLGCWMFQIDLSSATVLDSDANGPDVLLSIDHPTSPNVYMSGVCTYDENATNTGILFGTVYIPGEPAFEIKATGIHP